MLRVVLEGIPGAGKTTLVRLLSERLACPLVPECVLDEASWIGRRAVHPWYLVNEETRAFLGRQTRERLLLFDRHYVGALAFDYAYGEMTGDKVPYKTSFAWYEAALAEERIARATHVYVLDVAAAESLARQPRAAVARPLFGYPAALDVMRAYYQKFYPLHEPGVKVSILDGQRPLEETLAHIVTDLESIEEELSRA